MFSKLLGEPLIHFMLLGVGLFLLFGYVGGEDEAPDEIVISAGAIEHLKATFARTWQRPPTPEELDELIADRIREEVYYREATALGLDRDDTIVRRRMRQKMEFLAADVAERWEPTDEELLAFFEQSADSYRTPARFSFRHVYLDPQRHDGKLQEEVDRLLAVVRAGEVDTESLGDSLMLPGELSRVSSEEVAALLGDRFARQLQDLVIGRWQGPVASGYGVHLVLLEEREEGRMPSFEQIRDELERDWRHARRQEAKDELFEQLSGRYEVRVERAESRSSEGGEVIPKP